MIDHFNRLSISDPQTLLELCLYIRLGECPRDGFATAMYNDDFDPRGVEECDISRDSSPRFWVGIVHERTAVFDHENRIPKPLDIGECFQEHGCFSSDVEVYDIRHYSDLLKFT